jgi:carboxypeptidase Taq
MTSKNRTPQSSYDKLLERLTKIADLGSICALLGWDQETFMPEDGAKSKERQMALLADQIHRLFTSRRTAKLLIAAEEEALSLSPDSTQRHSLRLTRRSFDKATMLSPKFVSQLSRATSSAPIVWAEAKRKNDFEIFRPELENMIALIRQQAAKQSAGMAHPYDALLDDYAPGFTTAALTNTFAELKQHLVPMIAKVKAAPSIDDSCLKQFFPVAQQKAYCLQLMRDLGLPKFRSRLDQSNHPFSTGISSPFDVRITTRFNENSLMESIGSTTHEGGHALYELGQDEELAGTAITRGLTLELHESQSRLWENQVGKSRDFWLHQYPLLQAVFPEQLGSVPLETFYRAINKSGPSFIRTESDELTYNLHIILRFELELALITGKLAIADLPRAWNDKFEEMFGIRPPSDTLGVLQDVHWSSGLIGYFPTYTLGNLVSAQLFETICEQLPNLGADIASGDYSNLLKWLRTNVHIHGCKYSGNELLLRVTKKTLTAEPFVRYLDQKFGEIYGWNS